MAVTLPLLVGVILLVAHFFPDTPEHGPDEAVAGCQIQVRKNLKTPSTATFVGDDSATGGDGSFFVSGHVDSDNSFGANIRTPYTCTVNFLSGGDVEVIVESIG